VAECEFAFHTMTHHSRYKTTDCTSVLFKRIFSASDIAHKLSSAQTKTEAIINLIIAPRATENKMQLFKNNTVSYCRVATGTRNHNAVKVFRVVIQYTEWKKWSFTIKVTWSAATIKWSSKDCRSVHKGTLENCVFLYFAEYCDFLLFVISQTFSIF